MALRDTAGMVGGLKSSDEIGFNTRVRVRCLSEEFKPSSKGNLMIEREFEIVHPEVIELKDGRKVEIIGTELTQYRVTKNVDPVTKEHDKKESDKSWANYIDERHALGLPVDTQLDDENPPLDLKGKIIEATISSQASPQCEPLTAEDRAAGKKQGKPIMLNGKAVIRYKPQIVALLQMAEQQVGQPY